MSDMFKKLNIDQLYTDLFFRDNIADSLPMAKYLAPKIAEMLDAKSVLDVGCATGHWLKCFSDLGIKVHGLEGSVNTLDHLMIPRESVSIFDLRDEYTVVHDVDIVLSIEVAEHIEQWFADNYVKVLTMHNARYIVMTAAPPGQGGTGHVNLQPKEYWVEKLKLQGYVRNEDLEQQIYQWCKEGRETVDAPHELKRLAVSGDGSRCAPGTVRSPVANWLSHEDAVHAGTEKVVQARFDNVWIPWWFPRNLICFIKQD
jgi:SAM-dependent methyltransferase